MGWILNVIINYFVTKKSFAVAGAAAGAGSVAILIASAAYTDRAVHLEKEERLTYQVMHKEYGDTILNEIRNHIKEQHDWNMIHYNELSKINQELRKQNKKE